MCNNQESLFCEDIPVREMLYPINDTTNQTYLPLLLVGKLSIRFAEDSLMPKNETLIKDSYLDTCTTFQRRDNRSILQHTHFRIRKFAGQVGTINVTITGRQMGCGDGLYVTPLTLAQSTTWLGRWITCTLLDLKHDLNQDRCYYYCNSPGYWKEIQVIKIPRTSEDYYWEICQINATELSAGDVLVAVIV